MAEVGEVMQQRQAPGSTGSSLSRGLTFPSSTRSAAGTRRDKAPKLRRAGDAVELCLKVAHIAPTTPHHGDWFSNAGRTSPACRPTYTESERRHIELSTSKSKLQNCAICIAVY